MSWVSWEFSHLGDRNHPRIAVLCTSFLKIGKIPYPSCSLGENTNKSHPAAIIGISAGWEWQEWGVMPVGSHLDIWDCLASSREIPPRKIIPKKLRNSGILGFVQCLSPFLLRENTTGWRRERISPPQINFSRKTRSSWLVGICFSPQGTKPGTFGICNPKSWSLKGQTLWDWEDQSNEQISVQALRFSWILWQFQLSRTSRNSRFHNFSSRIFKGDSYHLLVPIIIRL